MLIDTCDPEMPALLHVMALKFDVSLPIDNSKEEVQCQVLESKRTELHFE